MIEPIQLSTSYSADDYARGSLFIARRTWYVRYAYAIAVFVLWTGYGIGYALAGESGRGTLEKNLILFILISLAVGVIGILNSRKKSNPSLRRRFQKQIASSPAMQEAKSLTIDESGVSSKQSLGSGDLSWDAVIEVIETEDDLYLFTAKSIAQFIPKHAFANEREIERLRSFLRERFGGSAKLLQ